jgi:hypothetical protein
MLFSSIPYALLRGLAAKCAAVFLTTGAEMYSCVWVRATVTKLRHKREEKAENKRADIPVEKGGEDKEKKEPEVQHVAM